MTHNPLSTSRRQVLRGAAATAFGLALSPMLRGADATGDTTKPKRILYFTKSAGFQHSVITRKGDELAFSEKLLTEWGKKNGYEVTCSKDGSLFAPEYFEKFDAFVFYTTGDLTQAGTDKQPPMSKEGKAAFLDAIKNGKGFVGFHCASDTYHSAGHKKGELLKEGQQPHDVLDPYIEMIGGEFIVHGAQQKSTIKIVDDKFPGLQGLKDFEKNEEWYSLKNFAPDLHVIGVQQTQGMKGAMYERPNYPETWARMHGKGRVFFSSLGHREDVWESPEFQQIVLAALGWTTGRTNAEIPANVKEVCPEAVTVSPAGA